MDTKIKNIDCHFAVADELEAAPGSGTSNQCEVGNRHFKRLKVLGKGSFGTVMLVRKQTGFDNNKLYAMKVQQKRMSSYSIQRTNCERQILEAIQNQPFLLQLKYAFQTKNTLCLVTNYLCGGDLFHHIREFSHEEVKFYVGELVLAIEHLHNLGIIHRDIKLDNIILDQEGHIVLIDFGFATMLPRSGYVKRPYNIRIGTMNYCAPEVMDVQYHNESADWWSVGIVTYNLLANSFPFRHPANEDISEKELLRRMLSYSPFLKQTLQEDARDFILQLLHKSPTRRLGSLGSSEVKNHKFFTGVNWDDLLNKRIPPPIIPKLKYALDTRNFDREFTSILPRKGSEGLQTCASDESKIFDGYAFSQIEDNNLNN